MSAKKIHLLASVPRHGEAIAKLRAPGDAVLVERGVTRAIVFSCPCGCGESFPINLDSRAGPAWRLYQGHSAGITLFPSIWRESGCRSHFIVWRGRFYMFGAYDDDFERASLAPEVQTALTSSVKDALPASGLVPFSEIAGKINAVPWDVLLICRKLVKVGAAREGTGKLQGMFGRPNAPNSGKT